MRDSTRKNGTSIRQVDTEWLPDTTSPGPFADPDVRQSYGWDGRIRNDYKKTLSYREGTWFYALNAADRLLDYLSYGGEFYLANFNNCVNTWGQNIIESSKENAWLSPSGRIFEFFTAGFDGKYPLATKLSAGAVPMLKAQACETGAGGIVIYVVNLATETQTLRMALPPGYHAISDETLFAPDRLTRITQQKCEIQNGKITSAANGDWMLPPLSVTKLKAEK